MLPPSGTAGGGAWERPLRRGVCGREMGVYVHVWLPFEGHCVHLGFDGGRNGRDSPTDTPRSSAVSTLMERSGFTLPMICTPFPGERWASWGLGWSVFCLSRIFWCRYLCPLLGCPAKGAYGRGHVEGVPVPGKGGERFLTRFRWAVMFPSASMTASSPRSWTTLPTTMTCLPTYELR